MSQNEPHKHSSKAPYSERIHNVGKERYISTQWLADEWQQVWKRTWQAAMPLCDLEQPGDFAVYNIGPESILLTRNTQGQIRAFYNVCQHRGVRLVEDGIGHADHFRCAYHSWRYDTDGQLQHAPDAQGFQNGLPCEKVALKPVRCDTALGFVWITLSAKTEPLADYLTDMIPLMQHYQFEEMTLVEDQTVTVNCNWKAVHDNFSELYHVPCLHPQHRRFTDCSGATSECYPRGHTRVCVPAGTTDSLLSTPAQPTDIQAMQLTALGLDPADFAGRVHEVQAAIRQSKRAMTNEHPHYANFSDEELSDVMQSNVFPNTLFSYQPEMLWLIRMRPHASDPNRCYLDKLTFERFSGDAHKRFLEVTAGQVDTGNSADRPEHDSFDYSDVIAGRKSMTDTIDQDLSLLAKAQQGMHSEGFTGSWLNAAECRVSHFHQRLDEMMGPPPLNTSSTG